MARMASWIYNKLLRGNYTFTHDEVVQAFSNMSASSIARALTRGWRKVKRQNRCMDC